MPLLMYLFFLHYNFVRSLDSRGRSSGRDYTTLLKRKDEVIFIDEILLPALFEVVKLPSILQYYPKSAVVIKVDSEASRKE
jgi:hypothetical protein